ncbi:sensor histidine kinase [Pseudoxanthobacter sp. M-2]|uniref:sensor histidine kinase n=1 Tax=Pseudoxanthobacter sp. M-2 TaxID=3078754 RepID=UPI0038FC378B
MTEGRSFRLRSRRLGVWLVLLLVLANLPITVLALGSGLAVSEDRIAEGKRLIERVAALAASREAVLIAHLRGAVDAVDLAPAEIDLRAACARVADSLAVLQPSVRAVRIQRDNGRSVLCAEERDNARVELSPASGASAALTTRAGEVVVGTDTYTVAFAFRGDSVLEVELATATGAGVLADLRLDRGQAVAILDRAGRIVTAAGDIAAFEGADALVATLDAATQRFEVRMPNGQVMFAAAEAVPGADLTAIALAPLAMLRAAANRDLAIAVGLPLAFLVIAVAVAWYGIDQLVVRWVDRLGRVASLYGAGRSSVRAGDFDGAPRELRALADAFDAMADRVERRSNELKSAVDQKSTLLRELHHRVKNNFQLVASLLSLEASAAEVEERASVLRIQQGRVHALAIAHRLAYASGDIGEVPLMDLIREVVMSLSHGIEPVEKTAQVDIPAEGPSVSLDTAVPVALLVTELLRPALEAAVRNELLSLAVDRSGDHLVVTLEGKGGERNALSERLVSAFTRQLGATLASDETAQRTVLTVPLPAGA